MLSVLQHRAVLLDQNVPELGALDGEHARGARDPQVEMEYLVFITDASDAFMLAFPE